MANIPFMPLPPGPACRGYAVTKSDTTVLPNGITGLWIGGAGAIAVVFAGQQDSDAVTFSAVAAGTFLPFSVSKVLSTGTNATLIVAVGI
jgi:hypothetical protein